MSKANPYADLLDGRPLEVMLAATPEAIRSMLAEIGDANTSIRPKPGKWSAAEIVCHLADCELVFGFRLRQTLAEDGPAVQPFNQEKWAAQYRGIPANRALEVFSALRGWNLRLIQSALPAAASRTMTHPERGRLSFQAFVETIAGHDLNHLTQLRKMAGADRRSSLPA